MPTYEYRCKDCDHIFDRLKKISDPPVEECPECGGEAERLISGGAGLLFRGSGFYITDYRSESYRKAAESEKGSGKGESGSGSGSAAADKSKKPKGKGSE